MVKNHNESKDLFDSENVSDSEEEISNKFNDKMLVKKDNSFLKALEEGNESSKKNDNFLLQTLAKNSKN